MGVPRGRLRDRTSVQPFPLNSPSVYSVPLQYEQSIKRLVIYLESISKEKPTCLFLIRRHCAKVAGSHLGVDRGFKVSYASRATITAIAVTCIHCSAPFPKSRGYGPWITGCVRPHAARVSGGATCRCLGRLWRAV